MKSQIGKVFKWSKKREKRRTEYKSLPVGGEAAFLKKAVKEEDKKTIKDDAYSSVCASSGNRTTTLESYET